MTAYRELVNRVLAVKQAGLEMGLAKAREQEGFIRRVAALLEPIHDLATGHRLAASGGSSYYELRAEWSAKYNCAFLMSVRHGGNKMIGVRI